jgi:hypothetical protein
LIQRHLDRFRSPHTTADRRHDPHPAFTLLLGQFSSPIVLMLIGAAVISIFLHDAT